MNLPTGPTQATVHAQPPGKTETRLRGGFLLLTRLVWVGIALLALGLYVASIPTSLAPLFVLCTDAPAACNTNGYITPDYLRALQGLGLSLDVFAAYQVALLIVFVVVYTAIGAVLFWRKSNDRMALFASLTLVTFPAAFSYTALATLPSAWWWPSQVVILLGNSSLFLFFYLFPTGRFVPRFTGFLWVGALLFWAVNGFFPSLPFRHSLLRNVLFLGLLGSLMIAQLYRYWRVSSAAQRQQTKWVVFGLSIGLGGFLALRLCSLFFPLLFLPGPRTDLITSATEFLCLLFVPLSIGVAILRSRLFDIDSIINRTLVYGLLTACIVGLYVLVVGGLSTLLQARGDLLISLLATGLIAILFQPLRERLQRIVNRLMYGDRDDPYRIISRLGTQLEATLTPDALLPTVAETVAKTLKLPYVTIELKEEGELRQVAAYGTPLEPSLRLPLRYQQESIGQLLLASRSPGESFSSADRRLLGDLARQAGIAANAVQLSQDVQRSRERLLLAREEERRRLARELHDSVSQALYGISLGAHAAHTALDRDPDHVSEPLDYILSLAEAALTEMRALIFELRPESLETEGLVSALTKQTAAVQARHAIAVATDLCAEPDLPLSIKEDVYRIAQEAMHNTVKHAHASHIALRLDQTANEVLLEICDDGVGFDTTASFPGHLGQHSMRERVTNLGGTFEIDSTPDAGTRISVSIPGRK